MFTWSNKNFMTTFYLRIIKELGKLQSMSLAFEITWILLPNTWKIEFYILKFHSISKTQPSVSDPLMWLINDKLVADVYFFFIFLGQITLQNKVVSKKTKWHYRQLPKQRRLDEQNTISASNDLFSPKLNSQIIAFDLKAISHHRRRARTRAGSMV